MLTFISSAANAWHCTIATTVRRKWRKKTKNTLLSSSNTIAPFSLCLSSNALKQIVIISYKYMFFECIFMTSIICIVLLKCSDLCCFSLQKIDKYTIVSFVCDISTNKICCTACFYCFISIYFNLFLWAHIRACMRCVWVCILKAIKFPNFVSHNFLTIRTIRWQTRIKEMNYRINRCQTQSETKTLQTQNVRTPKNGLQPIDFKATITHFMALNWIFGSRWHWMLARERKETNSDLQSIK